MNAPLTTWRCDVCGKLIEKPDDGYVIWIESSGGIPHDFKIIHQGRCDLNGNYSCSSALSDFLGADGSAKLLAMLSYGRLHTIQAGSSAGKPTPPDLDEFVDLFRRLQTPYYEEARVKFALQSVLDDFADHNEVSPYTGEHLGAIAERASE